MFPKFGSSLVFVVSVVPAVFYNFGTSGRTAHLANEHGQETSSCVLGQKMIVCCNGPVLLRVQLMLTKTVIILSPKEEETFPALTKTAEVWRNFLEVNENDNNLQMNYRKKVNYSNCVILWKMIYHWPSKSYLILFKRIKKMRITFMDLIQICPFLQSFVQQKIVSNMNKRTSTTWWIRQRRFALVWSRWALVSNRWINLSLLFSRLCCSNLDSVQCQWWNLCHFLNLHQYWTKVRKPEIIIISERL